MLLGQGCGAVCSGWRSSQAAVGRCAPIPTSAATRWCEANRVDCVFGPARNPRLLGETATELAPAEAESSATGRLARRFRDFDFACRTLESRDRTGQVIGNAEWTQGNANARFIVTSLKPVEAEARHVYEAIYCARGEMKNRIKECQFDLFADRTSAATMRANQLRLCFASKAYVLLCALRRIGLAFTQFAQATSGTIRLKLLKIGAQITRSVRRVRIAMASAHPWQYDFGIAHTLLLGTAR